MPERWDMQHIVRAIPIITVVALSVAFYFFFTPQAAVEWLGIENAYLLMFTAAFLGGLTTFNTVPYYSMLLILATAGLNPLFLGLSSASGVMCGDSVSYLIGRQGAFFVPRMLSGLFDYFYEFALTHRRTFPIVCFFYGSLSPLSNDLITIPAGIAHIPYARVMIPLACGNVVFNVSLAYAAYYAYDTIRALIAG